MIGSLAYFMRQCSYRRTREFGGKAATPIGISAPSYSFLEVIMDNKDNNGCKCGGSGNCQDCPNRKK